MPHAITRGCVALIAAMVSLAGTSAAGHGQSPAEIRVGFTPLTLVAEGSRTDQLGDEALYIVAVYAETRPLALAALAKADTAKALRIEVVTDDDPFSPFTRPWRRELAPRLDRPATTQLLAIVQPMRKGDVLLVEYEPATGTTIHGNRLLSVSRAPHDLMVAFLDQWLGQTPVARVPGRGGNSVRGRRRRRRRGPSCIVTVSSFLAEGTSRRDDTRWPSPGWI